jgi:hypothetical protein
MRLSIFFFSGFSGPGFFFLTFLYLPTHSVPQRGGLASFLNTNAVRAAVGPGRPDRHFKYIV